MGFRQGLGKVRASQTLDFVQVRLAFGALCRVVALHRWFSHKFGFTYNPLAEAPPTQSSRPKPHMCGASVGKVASFLDTCAARSWFGDSSHVSRVPFPQSSRIQMFPVMLGIVVEHSASCHHISPFSQHLVALTPRLFVSEGSQHQSPRKDGKTTLSTKVAIRQLGVSIPN